MGSSGNLIRLGQTHGNNARTGPPPHPALPGTSSQEGPRDLHRPVEVDRHKYGEAHSGCPVEPSLNLAVHILERPLTWLG